MSNSPLEHTPQAHAAPRPFRLRILITWADDGRWYFLNRLRELGYRVELLEPLFLRSRWAPTWLKRISSRLCSYYQPIQAFLARGRCDAVATWNTRTGTVYGMVSRLVPKRLRPLHILRDFHLDLTRLADPAYMLQVLLVRLAMPGITYVLTTSQQEADLYGRMFAIPSERFLFFPDSPGWEFTIPRGSSEEDYVFAYGNSDRDFDTLLAAAPAIASRVVMLSQNWRQDGPVPANVEVITWRLSREELIERIVRARVVVVPIKSHFVAAGQNAMLEVMCLSRPLVVTNNLTTLEHATDGRDALFYPPGDVQALARSVNRLLSDPVLARTLGENARLTALAILERQVNIFVDVLGLPPAEAGLAGAEPSQTATAQSPFPHAPERSSVSRQPRTPFHG
jgi:glycosyltransferase involved in cell wall biosynthesis